MSKEDRVLVQNKPKLFKPATIRGIKKGPGRTRETSLSDLKDTNIESTSSFRYDQPGDGIKSTQQLDIDWSDFENHTFFNSAVSKVNVAFDRIINDFPFDGTRRNIEAYTDSLTGYEKYILDIFPRNVGYLNFLGSSTAGLDQGIFIKVRDQAGSLFPQFSSLNTGENVLDPSTGSFSIEMQLLCAAATNNEQVICQRLVSDSYGFGLLLSGSSSTTEARILFSVMSGSSTQIASGTIDKGSFQHVCAVCDRTDGVNKLRLYSNEKFIGESDGQVEIGDVGFTADHYFTIGSGSIQHLSGTDSGSETPASKYTPLETFSGSMDEFRFFNSVRALDDQKRYAKKTIYSSHDLRLYFKFNEPSGSTGVNDVVLDSSGKSLHARVTNYLDAGSGIALRSSSSFYGSEIKSPMVDEDINLAPVLFPKFERVTELNTKLLTTASLYDNENPNLITKLIPQHYLEDGQYFQGLSSIDGGIGGHYSGSSIPGTGDLGSAQLLSALLFIYAKQFDEIKLFIDEFSNIIHVDYDASNSVSDPFLQFAGKYLGIELPRIFNNASIIQGVDGENLGLDQAKAANSLNYVQNLIWRRILTNMGEITRSRGTKHSVKALIRSIGIEPDNILRIREFGGPSTKTLRNLRVNRSEVSTMLDFSGSLGVPSQGWTASNLNYQGFSTGSSQSPRIMSPYLSASRFEVGFPTPIGTFVSKHIDYTTTVLTGSVNFSDGKFNPIWNHSVHGHSNNNNDGLFTSGSWSYEAIYQIPKLTTGSHFLTQSLARMHVTGASSPCDKHGVIFNLIAYSGSRRIDLFGRPGWAQNLVSSPEMRLILTGPDIFDGNLWNVCFGRFRSDDPTSGSGVHGSSSFYLRCSRNNYGELKEYFTTASLFKGERDSASIYQGGLQQRVLSSYNELGSFIVIGSQSIDRSTRLLNDVTRLPDDEWSAARYTQFSGRVGHIRFWSKAVTNTEFEEHTRNFKSLGVDNPKINFNFDRTTTGSFGKLRLDVSTDQPTTKSDALGTITLTDFSQHFVFSGSAQRPWSIFQSSAKLEASAVKVASASFFHMSGSGFEPNRERVIKPHTFHYSHISPHFDLSETDSKVRVRSYLEPDKIEASDYAYPAPLYDIPRSDIPDDDIRFAIDFSIVQALNEDIMTLFSSLDFFNNALGDPNLMFDDYYPDLEQLRKIYFNRLVDKINIKQFFEFFKWFDTMLGVMIEQLIPKKTNFNGINFVIESHVLERHRMRYLSDDIYLKLSERESTFSDLVDKNLED